MHLIFRVPVSTTNFSKDVHLTGYHYSELTNNFVSFSKSPKVDVLVVISEYNLLTMEVFRGWKREN